MACIDCGRCFPSGWYQAPATADRCGKVTCQACGAERCHGEGTGRGTCKACFYGRLPGWSFSMSPSLCMYANCHDPVVYSYLPGSKPHVCKKHGAMIISRRNNSSVTESPRGNR